MGAQKEDKAQDAFRGRLGSKGTEHLFLEHMHPMNYRDSFTRNEITNDWMSKKEEREKTKRIKKKAAAASSSKAKSHMHMQTVTENANEYDDPSLLNNGNHLQKYR